MTDETDKLRTNSASGVGGKDYYPQVDKLVHASRLELLNDTVNHQKKAKSSITFFESITQELKKLKMFR